MTAGTTVEDLMIEKQATARPTIVCLCGSIRRAGDAFDHASVTETVAGNIVLSVGTTKMSDAELFNSADLAQIKRRLDILHLWKIDLADVVLILNKDGYIGESTERERQYALLQGKTVRYLEEPHP